jgi:carbon starvation protein
MFGVTNQLLAAIALGVGTTVIIKAKKPQYALLTFIPMLFMFTMTFVASWKLLIMFREKASKAVSLTEAFHYKVDAFLVFLMVILAVIALADMLYKWYKYLSGMKKRGIGLV